jgi:hypothetical protein
MTQLNHATARSVGQVAEDFDLAETLVRECALYCRVP